MGNWGFTLWWPRANLKLENRLREPSHAEDRKQELGCIHAIARPWLGCFCALHRQWPDFLWCGKPTPPPSPVTSTAFGTIRFGVWSGTVNSNAGAWSPGQTISIQADVNLDAGYLDALAAAGYPVDQLFTLVTAERIFDADGWGPLPSHENLSTLLTPTGLAIEGGVPGHHGDEHPLMPCVRVGGGLARRGID